MTQEEKEVLAIYNHRNRTSYNESNWINGIHWPWVCIYQNLSEAFIERHQDRVDWQEISHFQKLSEPFIEKFADRVDWESISACQRLSDSFIKKHADHLIDA